MLDVTRALIRSRKRGRSARASPSPHHTLAQKRSAPFHRPAFFRPDVTCEVTCAEKAAKYEVKKPSTCRSTSSRCKVWVDVSSFSPCVINLSRNKNICCGLKKVVAKSRAQDYFEQQILALLLVFHQTHNLSRHKFARALKINQSAHRISSTRNKCFCCGSR